jgi:hypothetical protein
MRIASLAITSLATLASLTALAAADPSLTTSSASSLEIPTSGDTAVGFRIGGYGFRREGDFRPGAGWNECRMNGLGVFLQRDLRGPLFVEGGLDAYFTQDFIESSPSTDLPLDRMSGLISAAIGAHSQLTPWLRGYVQLGAGVELTRLSVPYGDADGTQTTTIRADKALPEGFFGVGADVRISRGTYIGASIRMLLMGNFDYSASRLMMGNQWVAQPTADQVFAATPDLAAQGQFYLRRAL